MFKFSFQIKNKIKTKIVYEDINLNEIKKVLIFPHT